MPKLVQTPDGFQYWTPDEDDAPGVASLVEGQSPAPNPLQSIVGVPSEAKPTNALEGRGVVDKLFGLTGPRYQTWPEKAARDAIEAVMTPGEVYKGNVSVTGDDGHVSPDVIKKMADLVGVLGSGSFPMAMEGALGTGGGRLVSKSIGDNQANSMLSQNANNLKIKLDTLDNYLKSNNIPFRKDISKSIGSLSSYYYIETPNGTKKLRVSDHIGGVGEDVNFPLGSDAEKAFNKIHQFLGSNYNTENLTNFKNTYIQTLQNRLKNWESKKSSKQYDQYGAYDYDRPINLLKNEIKLLTESLGDSKPDPTLFSNSGPTGPALLVAKEQAPVFYSAVENALNTIKQNKATGDQWLGMLRNSPGVKQEELSWLGLDDWLAGNAGKPVSKRDLESHVQQHRVEVRDALDTNRLGVSDDVIDSDLANIWTRWAQTPPKAELVQEGGHWLIKTDQGDNLGIFGNKKQAEQAVDEFNQNIIYGPEWPDFETFVNFAVDNIPTEGNLRHSQHVLPGGNNYHELLLTLPAKGKTGIERYHELDRLADRRQLTPAEQQEMVGLERSLSHQSSETTGLNFQSSHWDEPNVLAHVRFNDRTIDGKKTLFMEEVQSDWHQQGRKQGYKGHPLPANRPLDPSGYGSGYSPAVPDAPFKSTEAWVGLALKRMIRYAAEHGYEQIAWTPGEVQAKRWMGTGEKGHEKFYDEIMVNVANKLGKPYGEKVRKVQPDFSDLNRPISTYFGRNSNWEVHALTVPDKMRDTALSRGFPLFASGVPLPFTFTPVDHDPFEENKK